MLVVSRKKGESFTVGTALVKILSVDGGKVRIGVDGGKDVPVHRFDGKNEPSSDDRRQDAK